MLAQENSDKEFIELYLKIQNLEKEIATLRNEIEVIQTQLDFYQEKNIHIKKEYLIGYYLIT